MLTACLLYCLQAVPFQQNIDDSIQPTKIASRLSSDAFTGPIPESYDELWNPVDFHTEPLNAQVIQRWQIDDVAIELVRFRVGVFHGQELYLGAIFGFPSNEVATSRLPGLLQIHGGGQYADYRACVANAKRGYATLSIAWAGRINAPSYVVSSKQLQAFWESDETSAEERPLTDWGPLDGYHAPSRNPRNTFVGIEPHAWTIDKEKSPRNSGWFLAAYAARRALTFLEQQPIVDRHKIGVYGHSMGGKLTIMTAADPRVRACVPSCGGISDLHNVEPLYSQTLCDDVYLKRISCPTLFLSPTNDFHGRIGDLADAVSSLATDTYRVVCSPHHNHQDTAEYEVATLLWFDQHLKNTGEQLPASPKVHVQAHPSSKTVSAKVHLDDSRHAGSVDVFYTQHGHANETNTDREMVTTRFWHHCQATLVDGDWEAELPVSSTTRPLWVLANVTYQLDDPVHGAGYYYADYKAETFVLSSLMNVVPASELQKHQVEPSLHPSLAIEDFQSDWERDWFSYRKQPWSRTTHKLNCEIWKGPDNAVLCLDVRTERSRSLVIRLDDFATEIELHQPGTWHAIRLEPSDFADVSGQSLTHWRECKQLELAGQVTLRSPSTPGSQPVPPRILGQPWLGPPPDLRNLRWEVSTEIANPNRAATQSGQGANATKATLRMKTPTKPTVTSESNSNYRWTRDHIQIGVRWQPFIGFPEINRLDGLRPLITEDSSYVQLWGSWAAIEPLEIHCDYQNHPSPGLQALEQAIDRCHAIGLKVELVFFHCPAWATESGKAGGYLPKPSHFQHYARRMATHFKDRVDAWQVAHEANLQSMLEGADIDFVMNEVLIAGAKTIREVYNASPPRPVLISTTGMSPCSSCPVLKGLNGIGGKAILDFYDRIIANQELMALVDALNMNVSDHGNGFGRVDAAIPSVWDQYRLLRNKLDLAGFSKTSIRASESWIVWDDANHAHDINQDGQKNEQDAVLKAIAILGSCLERGLNTINLPWSDNSSAWAMGLTKRRDYGERVAKFDPAYVIAAADQGPAIVTRKIALRGNETQFEILDGSGNLFDVSNYANPPDPNHLHYYIWRWYAQIAGGANEVIRHAIASEAGNDIELTGTPIGESTVYRIAAWDRTRQRFRVWLFVSGADGSSPVQVTIPATIQTGKHYNNLDSPIDFRGEGFPDDTAFEATISTKNISLEDGSDLNRIDSRTPPQPVVRGKLSVTIPNANRFTQIEIFRAAKE